MTLNAVAYDKNGQVVETDREVEFVGAHGGTIGTVEMEQGSASYQYVPEPTEPQIEKMDQPEITDSDGNVVPGWVIRGSGFSVDAEVYVDGRQVVPQNPSGDDLFYHLQIDRHDAIALAILQDTHSDPLEAGKHEVKVVNPGGESAKATVTVE